MLDNYFLKSLLATAFCLAAFIAGAAMAAFYWAWSALVMLGAVLLFLAWFYRLSARANGYLDGQDAKKPLRGRVVERIERP